MAFHLTAEAGEKRKRKHPDHHEPTKRQRTSKAGVQRSLRKSPRLNTAPREQSRQNSSVTEKDSPIIPQPKQLKRSHEAESPPAYIQAEPLSKRQRPSADTATARPAGRETQLDNTEIILDLDSIDPGVLHWIEEDTWPKEYFEPNKMSHLLARKKSTPSLRRKRSESSLPGASSTTPSDQKPREVKSAPYQDPRYETLLATKGSFIGKPVVSITQASKENYFNLLNATQTVPRDSLFSDELFEETCEMIRNKNEARVIRDVSQLIVPSAEILAARGLKSLKILVESVNEGWNNSIPLTGTRPQPDFSVGFKREAFSEEQREKLAPFISDFIAGDQSYFMATYYMYFPFLTCEVKCGAAALDIADRQNAHSMTLAVRAVVELFRLVKREAEINREILAFSVSHDHSSVRIYGHYSVINGKDITFYRHPIKKFDFTSEEGKEKWAAYKFTKNVYDVWMPTHFKRLCSIIDQLPPELDFDVAPLPQDSGLSQDLESHHLSQSFAGSVSQTGNDESRSGDGDITPNTSFTGQGAPKRPRRKVAK